MVKQSRVWYIEFLNLANIKVDFFQWSVTLSCQCSDVWEKEVNIRSEFLEKLSPHFLLSLFPGIKDMPPPFATDTPEPFDDDLPKVCFNF